MRFTRRQPNAFARQRARRCAMHVGGGRVWSRRCSDEGPASRGRAARPQELENPANPKNIRGIAVGTKDGERRRPRRELRGHACGLASYRSGWL